MSKLPFQYLIDQNVNCLFVRHYGCVESKHVQQRAAVIEADPDAHPDLNRLVDLSNCTFDISSTDAIHIANNFAIKYNKHPDARRAFLVDTSLAHGLLRMVESLLQSRVENYQIFDIHSSDASFQIRSWLDLNSDYKFPDFINLN